MFDYTIWGFTIPREHNVQVLRGVAQCMCVCLRTPMVNKALYIRGAQSILSGHDQDSHVPTVDKLFDLAFYLKSSC